MDLDRYEGRKKLHLQKLFGQDRFMRPLLSKSIVKLLIHIVET